MKPGKEQMKEKGRDSEERNDRKTIQKNGEVVRVKAEEFRVS